MRLTSRLVQVAALLAAAIARSDARAAALLFNPEGTSIA
jgi:hypothetical protein